MKYLSFLLITSLCSAGSLLAQDLAIIPNPNSIEIQDGVFTLSSATEIVFHHECKTEAELLQRAIHDDHSLSLTIAETKSNKLTKGKIYLLLSTDLADLGKEGYEIQVNGENIIIRAATTTGVFYGTQSLRQVIQLDKQSKTATVQQLSITDKPRFGWRAFLLDEGRYFKGGEEVRRILDEMALLKMNVFHWHLTDDTGWRIEIKKYPKLTEIGSTRKESEMGTWLSDQMDGKVHSGFYTQEEIKQIIKYARDRHITIIPEIEMPGHASAAIASYPWLGVENIPIEVPTKFRLQHHVFNVANPRVLSFLHDVLDEVCALFPSDIVHIGGDEVLYDKWKESPEVNAYMAENNIRTPADLQIAFTNSISNYLEEKKHRMMGWNEILGGHTANNDSTDATTQQKLSDQVIVHFWTGDPAIVNEAAEKGYDVVNSSATYTYLDYDYTTTSLKKAYSFDPIPESLPSHLHSKVLGLGCQMWGEWIPTVERMNEQIYPRIAAFSEIGWSDPERKSFTRFKKALYPYLLPHWKKRGIQIQTEIIEQ